MIIKRVTISQDWPVGIDGKPGSIWPELISSETDPGFIEGWGDL